LPPFFVLQNVLMPGHVKRRRKGRSILFILCFAAAVLVIGWVFQDALVGATVHFLVDPDPPEKADLIYVLGGNYTVRAPLAARLFREGWAAKILLAREPTTRDRANFTDTTIQILESNGVPKDRIVDFDPSTGVKSTADEARALKLYVRAYPVHKILVVTSSFHSRRARIALSRALLGKGVDIRLVVAENQEYTRDNWRQTQYGRDQVKLEWIKTIYYFFTFWG
jgi:uncharacterized SAM-binding protein YcdF (DUF218 family)